MATPYLRRGIRLGDRPATVTGTGYTTGVLFFNDFLLDNWMERSGAVAFTGAFYHTLEITSGAWYDRRGTMANPAEITTFLSGDRDAQTRHYPRHQMSLTLKHMSLAEFVNCERFYHMVKGAAEVIELVDENGNATACRWVGDFSYQKAIDQCVDKPFSVTITLDFEHVSETYSFRSGSMMVY